VIAPPNGQPAPSRPSSLLLGISLAALLLAWSFNYPAGKTALRYLDPLSLASLRIELAALLTLAVYFMSSSRATRRAHFRRKDLWTFAYLSFFGVVLNQGSFTVGLAYTTSERSVVLVALAPVFVLVFARALKLESFTPAKMIGMIVAIAGVFLLESEGGYLGRTPRAVGDLITLAGVAGFSIYIVLGKRVRGIEGIGEIDAVSVNTYLLVAAAVMLLPVALWQGIHLNWGHIAWVGWAGMLYMAAVSSVGAYTLFYWILRHMEASRVAAIQYLQPFIVIMLSMALLGERPTGHLISGGALILVGVYIAERVRA
jgi:drug/metabolite transporter (DMT)-like permease